MTELIVTAENLDDLYDEEGAQVERIRSEEVWADFLKCGEMLGRMIARLKPGGEIELIYAGVPDGFSVHPLYLLDALFPHMDRWEAALNPFATEGPKFRFCGVKRTVEAPIIPLNAAP